MIRRNHRKNVTRNERTQTKLQQMRNRVRESNRLFMERHEARVSWWRRAFRGPVIVYSWIYAQARTWPLR